MKNDKQRDMLICGIIVAALGLAWVVSADGLAALTFAVFITAGTLSISVSPVSESPAEFLVLTYLYR